MTHWHNLLGLPLLLLLGVSSGTLAPDPVDRLETPGTESADHERSPGGITSGVFDIPGAFTPGHLSGVMIDRRGRPAFLITADVWPAGPSGDGVLDGEAIFLHGPHAGRRVSLHGVWVLDGPGRGHFRARLLRPEPNGGDVSLEPFVTLRADFIAPPGPAPPPGPHLGRWRKLP